MPKGPGLSYGQLIFPLNRLTNTVGRRDRITNQVPDVDLATLDQERAVSRRHAEITHDSAGMSVRDTGSTNGTTVNGESLAHQVDRRLEDGDQVSFGGVTLSFQLEVEWPEGVEAEWPEPAPEAPRPQPEETMISAPAADETMVASPPPPPDETMIAPTPPEAAAPTAPARAETAPPAATPAPAAVACSNHAHLPAVAICPGCLEPFCVDCVQDRGEGLLACNRCAGIQARLAVGAVPQHAAESAAQPGKKKLWPF